MGKKLAKDWVAPDTDTVLETTDPKTQGWKAPETDQVIEPVKKKAGSEGPTNIGPAISPAAEYRKGIALFDKSSDELFALQTNIQAVGDVLRKTDQNALTDPQKRKEYEALLGEYNSFLTAEKKLSKQLQTTAALLRDQRDIYLEDNRKRQEQLFEDLNLTDEQIAEVRSTIFKQQNPDKAEQVDKGYLIPGDIDVDAEDLAKALAGKDTASIRRAAAARADRGLSDRIFGSFGGAVTKTLGFDLPAAAAGTLSNAMADMKITKADEERSLFAPGAWLKKTINLIPGAKEAINEKVDDARVAAFEWGANWKEQDFAMLPGAGGVPIMVQNPKNLIQSLSQVQKPLDAIDFVFSNLGQGAAQILPSIATRGITSYVQEIGNNYMEGVMEIAAKNGITPQEVIRQDLDEPIIAREFGLVQGALDSVGAGKVGKSLGIGQFGKDLKNRATSWFKEAGKAGGTEFLTEASQSVLQQLSTAKMTGLGNIDAVKNVDWFQAFDEGVAGSVGGAGIAAVGEGARALHGKLEFISRLKQNPAESAAYDNVLENVAEAAQAQGDPRSTEEIKDFVDKKVMPKLVTEWHIGGKNVQPEESATPEIKGMETDEIIDEPVSEQTEPVSEVTAPVSQRPTVQRNVNQSVADLSTDHKRFQNRDKEFSEESVQSIVNAVKEGKFDINEFDPIRVWKDPKDGKIYVLSGHSRTEAFKRLGDMLAKGEIPAAALDNLADQGITDFENIPAIDVSNKSEKDAIEFATERSNTLSTKETVLDRAKLIGDKRRAGTSESSLRKDLKATTQEILFSYLKPQGQTWDAVKAIQKAETEGNTRRVMQIGEFIGEARKRFPELNDSHENELFKYLTDGSGTKITTRADFISRLDNVVNNIAFKADTSQPLNLENRVQKGFNESVISEEIQAVENRIKALEREGKDIKNPPGPGRVQEITRELGTLYQERVKLRENLDKARQGDREQFGLFDAPIPTVQTKPKSRGSAQENNASPVEKNEPVKTDPTGPTETETAGKIVDQAGPISTVKRSARIEKEIDDLFDDLGKTLKSTLAVGINPEAAAIASKIIAKYVELGVVKFAEIAQVVYTRYGEPKFREFFSALKAGYGATLATAENTEGMNSLEEVRGFTEDGLVSLFKAVSNDTGTTGNLESDSKSNKSDEQVGKKDVPEIRDSDRKSTGTGKQGVDKPEVRNESDSSFSDRVPPPDSKRTNTGVPKSERPASISERPGRGADNTGSSGINDYGISSESGTKGKSEKSTDSKDGKGLDDRAKINLTDEQRIRMQKMADATNETVLKDADNIRATLPFLLEHQLENVLKAENKFYNPSENDIPNKGILFTDGTGTGKTYTGLGIAKRFINRGIRDGIIVVPTDAKAKDWIDEAHPFGISIHQLENLKDHGGEGSVVVTTYANFRQNEALLARARKKPFGFVIYDESHKLVSNQQGDETEADIAHKKLTISPNNAARLARESYQALIDKDYKERGHLSKQTQELIQKEAQRLVDQTKVVFLSASPFSYHKNLTYGDGYLFTIRETLDQDKKEYNDFFIRNFGYRIRYSKLTLPETGVDVSMMERLFHSSLIKAGAVSSTKIKLDKDYSREFVLVDDKLGLDIDEGYKIATDHDLKWKYLPDIMRKKFGFLYKNQLMESIKARLTIDRIRKHLELGRKVVVFHGYNNNLPSHPFDLGDPELLPNEAGPAAAAKREIERFYTEYPQYRNLDLSKLTNPIATLSKAFGDEVLVFNGNVPKKKRVEAIEQFNSDTSGKNLIVVQQDAGQEGISLHDITGKHQRVEIHLGMPYKPTTATQTEGRIYRIGQMSDAIVEYMVMHLNFEKHAYASKISERIKTAENLAFGEEARNLEDAFKEGYKNPTMDPPNENQGRGGKEADMTFEKIDDFQKAISLYIARGKRNAKTKAKEGVDYYATPEPVGLKMVEWLYLKPNEHTLEPSAGHGAIARWLPMNTNNRMIEPSYELRADLAINSIGDVTGGSFEDHHIVNKYEGIVMNPPYGSSGKTAMEHFEKAMHHLKNGGRVIAILPDGPSMETRLQKFWESKDSKPFHQVARISLPTVTFERAGTSVKTQILIVDRQDYEADAKKIHNIGTIDIQAENFNELFDRIKEMDMPARIDPFATNRGVVQATEGPKAVMNNGQMGEMVEGVHTKYGYPIFTVKMNRRLEYADYNTINNKAKQLGGYYSSFKGNGAIPGFIFKDRDNAAQLETWMNSQNFTEGPQSKNDASYNMVANPSKGRTPLSAFETRTLNKDGKPFKLYQSVIDLARKYNPDSTLGQGYTSRGALGTFYTPTKNLRVVGLNDLSVAMHELVHALDNRFNVIKDFIASTSPADTIRKRLTDLYVKYYPQAKPSDDLRKRMVEGYATLVQKYLEIPGEINQDYPELVDAFITPGGKYYQDVVSLFVNDAAEIIGQYQALNPLNKMGARIVNDVAEDLGTEGYLTAADKVTREVFDALYPLEKLAKRDGTHFTQDDISLWVRLSNNSLQLAQKNIASKKQQFWQMDEKGEWKPKHAFNYYTITRALAKRGLHDDFAAYLYGRRIHFEYTERNNLQEELDRVMSADYLLEVQDLMKVDEQTARNIVKAKAAELEAQIDRLVSILDNEGVSETEAAEAYAAGQKMFQEEEKMYDTLVAEDLEFAHNKAVQLLDDQGYERFKERTGYATFKRAFYDELVGEREGVPTIQTTGKTAVSQFLTRRGSTKPVLNPLIGAMMNHAEVLRKGMKQIVYNKFLEVADRNPDLFQKLTLKTTEDPTNRYPQEKDSSIIMARKDYKRVPILADAVIKQTLDENYDYNNANLLERVGITMAQLFRTGTTGIFWQFFINNTFLDQAAASINTRNGMVPFYTSFKTMGSALASRLKEKVLKTATLNPTSVEAAYLKEYMFLSGTSQTLLSADITARQGLDDIIKGLDKSWTKRVESFFENIVRILSTPGNMTELMTRGTEYILARKAGKSQVVALEEAGRVSAPFHHVGRHQYGTGKSATPYIRSVSYMNSALQVFKQTKDSLHTPEGRKRYAFAALSLMAASVGSTLYILGMDDDDERKQLIKSMPPDNMSKYLFLPNPYSTKRLIQIRVPEQLGFISGTMNMMLIEAAGQTDYKWTEYGEASMSFLPTQVNPFGGYQMIFSYFPQMIKPGMETMFGMKTYPDVRPIETLRDKALPEELRYNQYTSPAAIAIGEHMGWSPKKVDHFISGTFGRASKYVTDPKKAIEVGDVFSRELYMQSSRQVQFYYDTKISNDQNIKAWEEGKKSYDTEAINRMMNIDNAVLEIEGLMDKYDEEESNKDVQAIYTRNLIFSKIRDLEKIVYF